MFARIESDPIFRKKILIVFGLVVVMIVLFEIWSVNRLATYGIQIAALEQSKSSLKLENQILEEEIAQKSSLNVLSQLAPMLGFQKFKDIEYIR